MKGTTSPRRLILNTETGVFCPRLPLKVVNLVAGRYTVEWNQVMAATLLATLPVAVVFAALQRYLVQGLTLGSVK